MHDDFAYDVNTICVEGNSSHIEGLFSTNSLFKYNDVTVRKVKK